MVTYSHVSGLIATAFHTLHMTLITDQSTSYKGVKISIHSSSLIKKGVKSIPPHKYQPSSGISSSLLMKTSCLRLKLVDLNFFASFNADDQRKTYVSNVSKYTFKSSRWTFSIIQMSLKNILKLQIKSIFCNIPNRFQETVPLVQNMCFSLAFHLLNGPRWLCGGLLWLKWVTG